MLESISVIEINAACYLSSERKGDGEGEDEEGWEEEGGRGVGNLEGVM